MFLTLLADAPPGISLAEALARADRVAEVAIASAEETARAREADVTAIGAPATITFGTTRYSAESSVHVAREFRWAGQRKYSLLAATGRAEAAGADTEERRRAARREIRFAWLDLAGAEDAIVLGDEIARRAEELTRTTAAREAAEKVARLDSVRARAAQARVQAETAALEQRRAAAWSRLALLVVLPLENGGRTDGGRPPAPTNDDLTRLAAPERLAGHPALRAAMALFTAAEAEVEAAARARLPALGVELGADMDDPGLPGTDRSAALGLSVPLAGGAAAAVAAAERDAEAARLDALRRDLASAQDAAYRRALGARAQLDAYDRTAVPAAAEAAALTSEAYSAGRGDIFRVIEVERALVEARIARLDAYLDLLRAEADLRYYGDESEAAP